MQNSISFIPVVVKLCTHYGTVCGLNQLNEYSKLLVSFQQRVLSYTLFPFIHKTTSWTGGSKSKGVFLCSQLFLLNGEAYCSCFLLVSCKSFQSVFNILLNLFCGRLLITMSSPNLRTWHYFIFLNLFVEVVDVFYSQLLFKNIFSPWLLKHIISFVYSPSFLTLSWQVLVNSYSKGRHYSPRFYLLFQTSFFNSSVIFLATTPKYLSKVGMLTVCFKSLRVCEHHYKSITIPLLPTYSSTYHSSLLCFQKEYQL